ncbi:MAG: amidohydrolase family protein [Alphaproteobacteria bacterium]|nr:amidohydrolase family protein [Alphaproteobacteria bacterium]
MIDTDLHPMVPSLDALRPHLEPLWADAIAQRGLEGFESQSYPPNSPLTVAPQFRPATGGFPDLPALQAFLDATGTTHAILNCLYGVQLIFNADMNAGFTRGLNDWIRAEWLDRDPRLRAAIILPNEPEYAVAEIERLAPDRRFVQALRLVMGNEIQHGRRAHWPVYEALVRQDLPLCLHAGSAYRHPVTSVGWPSWVMEDAAASQQGFQSALASLITEGVFTRFPGLRVVFAESGCTWLPAFLWRLTKIWKGVRFEIPWQSEPPTETARRHIWLTTTPFDAPDDAVAAALSQLNMPDRLLPASDWPHGHAATALPISNEALHRNALAAYPRLEGNRP